MHVEGVSMLPCLPAAAQPTVHSPPLAVLLAANIEKVFGENMLNAV